ncbi:hypothetical protein FA13DRAFT_1740537 [Coprinellus micaceus]|uniref:Uncharacterized protein n=1 Tax=Coprinellus micaceus TaxID=71717 RepID=A0A4Y7SMK5_COPMI|nr:hypothetical protein FA13DRAFT_1740537 [Coprinellus micaceus]
MRKSADRSFVEVGGQRQIELRAASGAIAKSSTQYYTGICRIDGNDDFARQVQSGDTIVVWAEGHPDQVQYPRYASLKVVTQKPKFGFMDLGFLAGLSFKSGVLYQYLRLPPVVVILLVTLFHIIDAYIEDWIWSTLTMVMNAVFTSSTPLPLPSDTEPTLTFALPDFIDHCKVSDRDILQSPLKGLTFTQEKDKDISLLVDFEHAGTRYLAELFAPAPKYNMWHYASFVTTFHRLERDTVKLWRSEGEERAGDDDSRAGFVVKVHFKPEGGTTLLGVIDLLRTAKRRYWFHFWNNAKEWSWPWWLMRSLVRSANDEIEFVRLDGKLGAYSAGDASGVLFQTLEEWRAADVYPYGQNMLKDAVFVVTRTRAIYLIVLFFVSQQVLSPVVDDVLDRMKSALVRRIAHGG